MRKGMFYEASPLIFQRAKELRNRLTDAENILWNYLRSRPLGYKFRRQHPWGNYILDFYCHQLKLVIEIDGSIHYKTDIVKLDAERQGIIESEGISVMRFTNYEIMRERENVIEKINILLHGYRK